MLSSVALAGGWQRGCGCQGARPAGMRLRLDQDRPSRSFGRRVRRKGFGIAACLGQPDGTLDFITLDLPAAPPFLIADRATWIGVFGKALSAFSGQVTFVALSHGFIALDLPAAPPFFVADRAAWIGVFGEAPSRFGGQVTLILLFVRVERGRVGHLTHPGPRSCPFALVVKRSGWPLSKAAMENNPIANRIDDMRRLHAGGGTDSEGVHPGEAMVGRRPKLPAIIPTGAWRTASVMGMLCRCV